jgi:phospholipid transport system transporter-binding protein
MRSEAGVVEEGKGRYVVGAPLRFDTVPAIWLATRDLFRGRASVTVDFRRVGEVDSAGLALLVEWMRAARREGAEVHFENIPRQMQAMARVSGLEGLLP